MISAALLAVLLRVNLPVALITTLYTNPFTIVPLYLAPMRQGMGQRRAQRRGGTTVISGIALA